DFTPGRKRKFPIVILPILSVLIAALFFFQAEYSKNRAKVASDLVASSSHLKMKILDFEKSLKKEGNVGLLHESSRAWLRYNIKDHRVSVIDFMYCLENCDIASWKNCKPVLESLEKRVDREIRLDNFSLGLNEKVSALSLQMFLRLRSGRWDDGLESLERILINSDPRTEESVHKALTAVDSLVNMKPQTDEMCSAVGRFFAKVEKMPLDAELRANVLLRLANVGDSRNPEEFTQRMTNTAKAYLSVSGLKRFNELHRCLCQLFLRSNHRLVLDLGERFLSDNPEKLKDENRLGCFVIYCQELLRDGCWQKAEKIILRLNQNLMIKNKSRLQAEFLACKLQSAVNRSNHELVESRFDEFVSMCSKEKLVSGCEPVGAIEALCRRYPEYYEKCLKLIPEREYLIRAYIFSAFGHHLRDDNKPEQALAAYKNADLYFDRIKCFEPGRINVYIGEVESEMALQQFQNAAYSLEKARAMLRKNDAASACALKALEGSLARQSGDSKKAIAIHEAIFEIAKANLKKNPNTLAWIGWELSLDYLRDANLQQSKKVAAEALKLLQDKPVSARNRFFLEELSKGRTPSKS
ncbi:MAG: hypothetical protein K2X27_22980, partial [Candidatus Obscuribacterales bacterium]|nr:hypothetical protein [Candidatus Obscuribacterales bacterium]